MWYVILGNFKGKRSTPDSNMFTNERIILHLMELELDETFLLYIY